MRNGGRSIGRQLLRPRARTARTLAGVLLIAGLITAWTLTTPAEASASDGSSGSSLLTSVSCTSMSTCIALGAGGQGWSYNGSAWSSATPVDSSGSPEFGLVRQPFVLRRRRLRGPSDHVQRDNVVSSEARRPLGFTQFDLVRNELRSAWPSTTRARRSRSTGQRGQLRSSSTPRVYSVRSRAQRASFCVAVDYAGQAMTFNGTTWSAPAIDGPVRPPLLFGLVFARQAPFVSP